MTPPPEVLGFNRWLLLGGLSSFIIGLLHIATILGGAYWYRAMGAGEQMATLAEQGSWRPALVTSLITLIFFVWAYYALSASGLRLLGTVPFVKGMLLLIGGVYTFRGLAIVAPLFGYTGHGARFMVLTSFVSLVIGALHWAGLWRMS
ncbi:MAG: hypothetical protein AAGA85_09115 [Bacteroidota bacterium]